MAGAGHEISDAALRAVALARAARVSAGRRSDEHYRRLKRPPMWAGLSRTLKDPTSDTEEPVRRRKETPYLSAQRKGALPASPGGPPSTASTGQKNLRVLNPSLPPRSQLFHRSYSNKHIYMNPILRLYRIQPTGKSFRVIEMCDVRSGHAPRPHTQTGPPVSATRPSLVLFSRALCARMCAIAIALAQQHPPSPSAAASWLTTSSSPAFTSARWSDSSTQAAASIP